MGLMVSGPAFGYKVIGLTDDNLMRDSKFSEDGENFLI